MASLEEDRLRSIFGALPRRRCASASKLRSQFVELRFFICPPANHDSTKKAHAKWAFLWNMARPRGFEPLTSASGGQRSIQLSYGRIRA